MRFNKLTSLLILLLSLLILSNVLYAEEVNETTDNDISNKESIYIKSDSDLRSCFLDLPDSEAKNVEINLKQNRYKSTYILKTARNNETEKMIIINGNNSIIDGRNNSRFSYVTQNATLIVRDLTFTNMRHDNGVIFENFGKLVIENCRFLNSTVKDLYEKKDVNNLTISSFGMIYNDGKLFISNSIFSNNIGNTGTAIYSNTGRTDKTEIIINNCTFENNIATVDSVIYNKGFSNIHINNSIFQNNNITEGTSLMFIDGNVTLENVKITHENSLSILFNNGTLTANNVNIVENKDLDNIITNINKMTLNNTYILKNTASKILVNYDKMKVTSSKIAENHVNRLIENKNVINIIESDLSKNTINENLIINDIDRYSEYTYDKITLNILNTSLYDNTVNSSIILNNNTKAIAKINNTQFRNNTSIKDEGLINDKNGATYIYSCKFHNNTSPNLFIGNNSNILNVENNEYLDNNLKSFLDINYDFEDNYPIISGKISAESIYNTSINLGKVYVSNEDSVISCSDLENGEFSIKLDPVYTDTTLNILYDGKNHFQNKNIEITLTGKNEEYSISVDNLPDSLVYGDKIYYNIIVKNTGNCDINNVTLKNIVPDELIYINSSEEFSGNTCTLYDIKVNESRIISINASVKKYENLSLKFNISNENNKNCCFDVKSIEFLRPYISLNNLNYKIGDIVNISANIHNYNKSTLNNVTVKFKYKEVEGIKTVFNNNILMIENFKIPDNLYAKQYNFEIICNDDELNTSFSNNSKIFLSKIDTTTVITQKSIVANYMNLSIKVLDSNSNIVNEGSVTIKVNGCSVKTLKIREGLVSLINYKIDKDYKKDDYVITLVYIGNNKYNTNRNSFNISLKSEDTQIKFNYKIEDNKLKINYTLESVINNVIPDSGYVTFKINEKTISSKIDINIVNNTFEYDLTEINYLNSITVKYFGNNMYNPSSLTMKYEA